MHWWPRHTPRIGHLPGQGFDHLGADAGVLGPARPGRDEHPVGPQRPHPGQVEGVVAVHHRLGAQHAQVLDRL